ncbi:MAG: SprB repeat-containing protein, partial [Psychroserpens sp.]|nr:SprB repeat-containing protein [Psychroserpens sp.]
QNMTAPFTISNLFSGTHTIEIQDANGCGNLVSVDIPARLDIIPSITTLPSCNNDDGIIDLSVTGGTGTFTYTIAPYPASITLSGNTFTGVPSGLYTITIIDTVTSCTEEVTVVVPEATLPSVALAGTQVTCFGDNSGSFEINLSGYIGNYTYEVFDATNTSVLGPVSVNTSTNPLIVTGMTAGTFNVVITETDSPFCSTSGTVVINSPSDTLALTASESSNVSCDDSQGIISALATGGWGDYEYELSGDANIAFSSNNTFTDLSAGNYIVTVRDAEGCLESVNITLTAPNPITATFTPSASSLACFGDQNASITVTNVTGGQGTDYIYTLNTIAPNPSTSGPQTSNVFTDLGPGTYTIDISDGNACFTTSADIIINEPSPVEANLVVATTQTCLFETSLTLSATGGNGPYEFSATADFNTVLGNFNTSITFDMPVGEYQYYVRDANGCISNVSNEITID